MQAPAFVGKLVEPDSRKRQQPSYAKNWHRSIEQAVAVLIGVPTTIGAYFFGVEHWMTPALTLVAAVGFLPIMKQMRNESSRKLREEDRAASADNNDLAATVGGRPNPEGIRRNENESVTGTR